MSAPRKTAGNPNLCDACRLAKKGCDGTRPSCGRCIKKSLVCSYTGVRRAVRIETPVLTQAYQSNANNERESGEKDERVARPKPVRKEKEPKKTNGEGRPNGGLNGGGNGGMDLNIEAEYWPNSHTLPVRPAGEARTPATKHKMDDAMSVDDAISLPTSSKKKTRVAFSDTRMSGNEDSEAPSSTAARNSSARPKPLGPKAHIYGTKAASTNGKPQAHNGDNERRVDPKYVICNSEEGRYLLTAEADAQYKRDQKQKEVMLALRERKPRAEPEAVHFDDIDLSKFDPRAEQAWKTISEQVYIAIDLNEGMQWDVQRVKRNELIDLIVEVTAMQKTWRKIPEMVLALGKLVRTLLNFHDFYDQLSACMTSTNALGLAMDPPKRTIGK